MNNPYISGKQVYLRTPTEEDALGSWHAWFSDELITRYMIDRYWPNSQQAQLDFVKYATTDRSRMVLSVVTIDGDKHIGVVGISGINWVHRYGDVSIVIGDKAYQKGTYALEAFGLLLQVAFNRINLERVRGSYAAPNDASRLLQQIFRFSQAGAWKDLMSIDGKRCDVVLTCLTRSDWERHNARLCSAKKEIS